MASLAFRIAASMGTSARTGTGSGAEILASVDQSWEQDATLEKRALGGEVKMKEDCNEDQVSFLGSMGN